MFEEATLHRCGWAERSSKSLAEAGIDDWQTWCLAGQPSSRYTDYVSGVLRARSAKTWESLAAKHTAQVPYLQTCGGRGGHLSACLSHDLSWDVLLASRSHCRLRAGLITLRTVNGRRSTARFQNCIYCSISCRNSTVHVLGKCEVWSSWRAKFTDAVGSAHVVNTADSLTLVLLRSQPGQRHYPAAAQWSRDVDAAAKKFWYGTDAY